MDLNFRNLRLSGKVEAVIDIELPRPRARAQDTFQIYRSKILDILNLGGDIGTIEYQI